MMRTHIVDTSTSGHKKIIDFLRSLPSVTWIEDLGCYRQDSSYSCLSVNTRLTADEVEELLYQANLDYVGVVEQKDE
jgi:hypothetical protein